MLKIQINLTHEQVSNHSQVKLTYFMLKDENNEHWLLPIKPEIDIYKPKVVKGKIKPIEPKSSNTTDLLNAKVYNVEEWLNNEDIDETIEQLLHSPRLNKLVNQEITGELIAGITLNSDTGKFNLEMSQDIALPMNIVNYGIHAIRTNVSSR